MVKKLETENKWWHRLFVVFLFGSGIIVFILSIFLTVDSNNHNWITYNPAVFSFEQNYNEAGGKEIFCTKGLFSCTGIDLSKQDESRYWTLYQTAVTNLQKQFGMDKYDVNNCPHTSSETPMFLAFDRISGKTTSTQIASTQLVNCVNKVMNDMESNPAYSAYQTSVKNLDNSPSFKITKNIQYGAIIGDVVSWVIIPIIVVLIWILFWSSIVYRSVLYIVFGNKK